MRGPLIFLTIWILGVGAMAYIHKDPVPPSPSGDLVEVDPEWRLMARCNGVVHYAMEEDELPERCDWVAIIRTPE